MLAAAGSAPSMWPAACPACRVLLPVAALPLLLWAVLPELLSEGRPAGPDRRQAGADRRQQGASRSPRATSGIPRRIDRLQGDITALQTAEVRIEADLAAKRASSPGSRTTCARSGSGSPAARGWPPPRRARPPARGALQGRRARRRHGDPRVRRLRGPDHARRVHRSASATRTAGSSTACARPRPRRCRPRPSSTALEDRQRRVTPRSTAGCTRSRPSRVGSSTAARTTPRARQEAAGARLHARGPPRSFEGHLRASPRRRRRTARAACSRAGSLRPAGRPDPPGLGVHDLAGQRRRSPRRSACAGAPARGHRHRGAGGHADPPRRSRAVVVSPGGRAATATTPASATRPGFHVLRAPVALRDRGARNVSRATVIGYVGNTGTAFGAHLHFEVAKPAIHVYPGGVKPPGGGARGRVDDLIGGQRLTGEWIGSIRKKGGGEGRKIRK